MKRGDRQRLCNFIIFILRLKTRTQEERGSQYLYFSVIVRVKVGNPGLSLPHRILPIISN